MKVSVDDFGTRCLISLTDTPLSVANGLRRACLENVPVLAFERLEITTNTSAQPDEVLAHRLGLVTLRGDGEAASATLDVTCAEASRVVTMRDFEWPENVSAVHPDTPLVELERGQRLRLSVEAAWGTGRDHAKWNACTRVALRHGDKENEYAIEVDSRNNHLALEVASIACERTIESFQEMVAVLTDA